MSRVLVLQMWGLGNAILTTPLVKAIRSKGHEVDVLVEKGRAGSLAFQDWDEIGHLWVGNAPPEITYDHAFFAHPAKHYIRRAVYRKAHEPRIKDTGKGYMWSFDDHEVEVLCDMARSAFNYQDETPELRVPLPECAPQIPTHAVALGIGYLKSHPQWAKKHWGNAEYASLAKHLYADGYTPIIVGGPDDCENARDIESKAPMVLNLAGRLPFTQTVGVLQSCVAFIGNDSGLMHVAAAVDIPTAGIFLITNPTKNRPWCSSWRVLTAPSVLEALVTVEGVVDDRPDRRVYVQERHSEPAESGS